MILNVIASGSSGNCYLIENNNNLIFIDAGATLKSIKQALNGKTIDESKNITLFVTHEHTDHISGILPFISSYNPKIYSSLGTKYALVEKGIDWDMVNILKSDMVYDFSDFQVMPFNISHDAVEPFGYKFNFSGKILSIATDFGMVTKDIKKILEDSHILILESNYEDILLQNNHKYPPHLKKRIKGRKGHLSNKEAFSLITYLINHNLEHCFLGHVSENNNDYNILEKYADVCNKDYNIKAQVLRQKMIYSFEL